ncbi:MAG: FAD-binding oxidoreductase, partial [Phycisphaerae bacterium]
MTRLPILNFPSPSKVDPRDAQTFGRDLANAVEGEIRFGLHDRMLYATDASLYQVEPVGVFIPASIEDAVRGVRFAFQRGVPILPRGGGT